ncbi:hypothetical protein thsps21_01550 [Pseudomonas sp. No.21]|uniref:hypothetical protein n=1 Tax=Pseudomonas tohonis TaxID=2725477 RepID=UPI001F25DF33|nr:hypothetical protein [Pseudomonas tohonis]GJN46485.1 hypothetical protein TUM20249_24710 [Pseudomonas tohonis]
MRRKARILILCKTYPSPSAKYAETSCVAGMDEHGALIRLFPVPFRLIGEDQQFAKWQWIKAVIEKSTQDHRPESHKIGVDTIQPQESLPAGDWLQRRRHLEKLPLYDSFEALEQARLRDGITLGLLRPARITGLQIRKAGTEQWTAEELEKLEQMQRQASLFDEDEVASIKRLEKVPFDFYYDYECQVGGQMVSHTHKISDWEACELYRKVRRKHGSDWEAPFREKIERVLPSRDLMFLMGNMHRFPGQWLIVSLIYPPRLQPGIGLQLPLL